MNYFKFIISISVLLFGSTILTAQTYQAAIAYPVSNITIDGNLNDWPENLESHPITHLAFGEITEDDDLNAAFKVAYNLAEKAIYFAVQVIDSDIVNTTEEENIDLVDNMYLYLDPVHHPMGGSRILFISGKEMKEYSGPAPNAWSPHTPNLTWDDVEIEVQQNEQTITYEWKVNLGDNLKIDSGIGLDFIISDFDTKDEDISWLTWKNGIAKSLGAQRLGEVILVESPEKMGYLNGNIAIKDSSITSLNSIIITSIEKPNIWFRVGVDSMGSYQCTLPEGHYQIKPDVQFTSGRLAEDFNQKSKPIVFHPTSKIWINRGKTTQFNFTARTQPLPQVAFKNKGILLYDDFDENAIDRFVKTYQDYFKIPGISIALIKNNELIYDKVFGVTNTITNQPLAKSSLFEGASITKSVFALMVLKLAENGKIDLDKPLYKYLRFPNIEHDERYKLITARQVLNHQTGLDNWPIGSYTGYIPADAKANLLFEPGTDFLYSGEAMNYLGRVVEKITEKPLHQLFNEEIATAFGLKNSYFSYSNELEGQIAMGHSHTYPRYKGKFPNVNSPASSITTEANDFSKLLLGLLNKEYLNTSSYQLISTPFQQIPETKRLYDQNINQGIAHGFFVSEFSEGKAIMHGGNNGDFDCKFVIMPDNKLGYVVFTNNNLGDEFIRLFELYLLRGKAAFEKEFR